MESGLKGKTVLLTGASGGIGSEIAKAFADEGANLVLTYFKGRTGIEKLKGELEAQHSEAKGCDESEELKQNKGRTLYISVNLTSEADVDKMFREADKSFGRIDVLVACAGAWSDPKYIADRTLEEWETAFKLNSTACFLLARGFFRNLRKYPEDNASIVFIGSTAGDLGEAQHHDYAATKSAITVGLLHSLKVEIIDFAKFGRVNAVNPGWTATAMTRGLLDDRQFVNTITSTIPLRKVATTKDVANAVLFLSSDLLAGDITGEVLTIAGGMRDRLYHGELKGDV